MTAGNASVVHRTFDSYGNVTEVGDANGNFTDFTYDANNLYPITEVDAHKTPVQRTFQYSWDYNVGVVTSKTDQDNSITTTYSYDPQGRQTQVVEDSVGLQRQTNTTYNDAALQVIVKRDQVKSGDGVLVSTTTYDQLYRPTLAQDASGSKVQTRYLYGGSNSYKLVSNPFQAATSAKATAEPTMGWTLSTFDQNGRLVSAQSYNGNALPTPFGGGNTSTSGTVTTSYSSNTTTVTDQVGNARTTTVDGAGRLVGVVEDPGATGHFNYTTSYTYDALDDLSGVNQSGLTRTFTYDSLKRLANAVNPESGSISYTYDANGNLLTRLDARGYTTKYGPYDALNRSAGKTYTDGTPAVSYTYDSGGLYSIGHLTAVANAYSSTSYGSFDALGRVGTSVQTTGGPSYTFSYGYNLGGALTSETYPSKRMVTTAPDAANRPSAVGGKLGTIGTNYVANVLYASHGAPLSYVYGNNVARTNSYNGRLQMGGYIDTNNKTMVQLVNATLTWGVANDNGNLQTATYANGGTGTPASLTFTQTFGYDNVNRLISASDNGGWSRNFGYDAFGNQWVSGSSGIRLAGNTPTSGSAFNANNQIAATPSSYDASGNQKLVNGNTPTYDAENRQTSVTFGGLTESYFYDGSGQRVEKTGPSGTTVFVYDALGMLAAEYSTAGNASPCATCYLSGDHLGSTRLVTDGSGNVIGRHDYLPFGEEIAGNAAGRNGQWGAGNDLVEQKFTGKERDAESGLDYFGARYYGSALGRWTSPDKLNLTSARLLSPTNTLNKYAYAANNPLKFIDPDGRDVTIFYRPPTSFPFDFGHVLIGALNQSTGKAGFLDYYPRGGGNGPGQFNLGTMQERAAARDQFLTLTVQTSPEEAQQVLDLITKLTGSNPPDYAALSNNCTTVCQDVLHDLGLDFGDVFPKDYWADVYRNFSPAVWDNPFKAFFVPTKPGMEYGNPRNVGTDFATFLFQVYLNQQLNKPVTACVDAHDDKGNSTGQTCSQ